MTDAERLAVLREKYRGLQGDMPPFGDVIFLLRLLDQRGPERDPNEKGRMFYEDPAVADPPRRFIDR